MSEQLKYNPELSSPPAHADGPEGAFFDPNELPPIQEIDLNPIRKSGKRSFVDSANSGIDQKFVVRYLNAAAEGSVDDETFEDLYETAAKKAIDGGLTGEHYMAIHETIEANRPRVVELLDRVQSEQLFLDTEFVAVKRVALLVSAARMVTPH